MSQGTSSSPSERERLAALASYNILDTSPEAGFDDIALLARAVCGVPVALVSFVESDRQWFKASAGADLTETPIDQAICKHAMAQSATLVIPDLTLDPRTQNNPLVTGEPLLRFYAGALLKTPDGVLLGTVCVLDFKPRPEGLTAEQTASLEALARQVMALLELRRSADTSARTTTQQRQEIADTAARADASDVVADSLRASEGRMRLAQEAGHVGSFEIDFATNMLTVTEQFCDIFGLDCTSMHFDAAVVESMVVADDQTVVSKKETRADGSAPLDVEYRIRRADNGQIRWIARRGQFAFGNDGKPNRLLGTVQDITDRKTVDARQKILNDELSHRLKNTLAMVQAIARQTLRHVTDRSAVNAFDERINALSRAHDILLKQSWSSAQLRDVIVGILALHGDSGRFRFSGSDVTLGPRAVLSFSLLLHELGTNAQKYGALSVPSGHIDVGWEVAGDKLIFRWIERGGPPVVPPTRIGLGSRLIDMGIMGTSEAVRTYHPLGLEVLITAPAAQLSESSASALEKIAPTAV